MIYGDEPIIREFLNEQGFKEPYDACSEQPLEEAQKFYTPDVFKHVGYGYDVWIDGTKNRFGTKHTFFRYTKRNSLR